MSVIRNILVRVGANINPLQQGMAQAQRTVGQFSSRSRASMAVMNTSANRMVGVMATAGAAMVALGAAAGVAFAAVSVTGVKAAMEYESSLQQINRIMGASAAGFVNWAETQANAFNMSRLEAVKYGAVYGNLMSTITSDQAQATQYTTQLLKASAVVASATGRNITDVMERIRSGLLGNTESIEDLGINVNIALLESTETFKRFANGKSWEQLDFRTQQQIRLFGILEQATSKFGDSVYNNTASGLMQFTALLKDAQLNLGQAFLPLINAVMPTLINFANGLKYVTAVFSQFMQTLFGVKTKQTDVTSSAAKAAGAQTGLAKATKAAGAAASKSVAGFDEINQLQEAMAASGADAADGIGGGGTEGGGVSAEAGKSPIPENLIPQSVIDGVNGFKAALEPASNALGRLRTALEPFTETLFAGLRWLYDNVLVPLASWTVQDAAPAFLNALAGAATLLDPILLAFKPTAMWLWEEFLKPIALWTGGVIVATLNDLGTALTKVGKWMTDNQSTVTTMTEFVIGFMAAWKGVELLAFIQMSGGVAKAFTIITDAIKASTLAKLVDKWETIVLTAMYAKDLVIALGASTWAFFKQTAQVWLMSASMAAASLAAGAHSIAMGIATAATWLFNAAIAVLTSPITLVIGALALLGVGIYLLVKHWDTVKQVAADTWAGIKLAWSSAAEWFGTNVTTPIKSFFAGLWDDVKNLFKEGANGAIGALESFLNFAISGFNKLIHAWNMTKSALGISGWTMPIEEIHLPRLAKGGIVRANRPMLAQIGDNKTQQEVVAPLGDLTDMITSAVSTAMLSIMQFSQPQSGGQSQNQAAVFNLDGTQFARAIIPLIDKENSRTGTMAIQST